MDDLFCFHVSALTPRTPDTPNLFGGDLGNQVSKQPRYPQTTQHKYSISNMSLTVTTIDPATATRDAMRTWISSTSRAIATLLHGSPTLASLREVMQSVGYPNLSAVIAEGSMDTLRECSTRLSEVATIQGLLPSTFDVGDGDGEELASPPAEIDVPPAAEDDEIARLVAEAEDLAKRATAAAKAVAAAASAPRAAGMTAADREKIDKIEDMVIRHDAEISGIKTDMSHFESDMADIKGSLGPLASILDAIKSSGGTSLPPAVTVAVKAAISGDRLLTEVLPFFTPGLQQGNQIPCVASPPSFGKTFMSDEISRLYDGSFFHPFKDSLDEVDSLVGTLMPRSDGTFAVIDGPLVSAARLASTGVNTLFIGDEIFNASKKTLEWMQSFLSPRLVEVVNPDDGTTSLRRCFVIQTKHSLEDGTFEVIKAPEECLHFLFLGNLRSNPPEALMSRCRLMRFDYEEKWAAETAMHRLEGYSGGLFSGPSAEEWAIKWAKAMTASREAHSRMEVSRPLCFRFLIGAITHVARQPAADLDKLTAYVMKWAPHQIAVQNASTQDTDKSSTRAVNAFLAAAF